jgi:transposase
MRVELEAEARRVRCKRHGVVVAAVPWARPHSGFTRQFEDTVAWLTTQASQYAVKHLCRVAWRTVGAIITRVVAERDGGRKAMGDLRRIGIDEKSYRKGHRYITMIVDHDRNRLVWAAPGRSSAVLRTFFDLLGPEASARIEVVSRDAAPWIAVVLDERCPEAVQCMDPFHVIAWATEAVEKVRRDESRYFNRQGHRTRAKYVKGTRWIVRTGIENLNDSQREGLDELSALNTYLYRAYILKEQLREAYRQGGEEGCALITAWIEWARESGLYHMEVVADRIANHLEQIHAALRHRVSNARTEAFNTRLQMINRRAYGFHSAEALIALAKLDLGRLCPPLPGRC